MNAILSQRLLHSRSQLSSSFIRLHWNVVSRNGRLLSTSSDTVNGQSNTEEGKVLVLGGNGYVGSHICKEALSQGLKVSSLSRSGRALLGDSWADRIEWHTGDLLSPDSLKNSLSGVTSVISCVGGFGSNAHMYKINGTANINAARAAKKHGVKRFVYISAADFGLLYYLLRGYYDGKGATEAELVKSFPQGGVFLRPGFIHGTRKVGNMNLNLSVIGAPLEMVLKHAKPLTRFPIIGPLFIAPVSVTSVAKVAVRAATDPSFPPGIVDVSSILQHSQPEQSA